MEDSINDLLKTPSELSKEEKEKLFEKNRGRQSSRPMGTVYPKYIQRILQGESPSVSIYMYGGNGTLTDEEKEERLKEQEELLEKHNLLQSIRMPWFCPNCKKIMKKKIDEKFWHIRNKCFDCVSKEEHKIRLAGKWEIYEAKLVTENKISFLKDVKQQVMDYIRIDLKTQYEFVKEDGTIEKWKNNEYDQNLQFLNNQLKEINNLLLDLESYSLELKEKLDG